MMTSRENIRNLMEGKPAERVGLMDNLWADTQRKWLTQGYPSKRVHVTRKERVREGGRFVEKEVELDEDQPALPPHEHFGYDMVKVGGGVNLMPLLGVSEIVDESDEWIVRRNGAGAALKYWKRKSGTPEHMDFRMTSREIWERDYRRHLLDLNRERFNVEGTRENLKKYRDAGKWTEYGNLFIWENMRQSMGDICLYESLLLDPAWIHDYNRVYTDLFIRHYTVLFDEAGVPEGFWMYEDLGYNKGLFASPKVFAELIFPYFKEIVDFMHSRGVKVVLHTCGSTREALPMIIEAGFDALHPMERAAGNDPFEYAEKYGDKLVFVGGFDKRILETHDRDLIRRATAAYIEGMKARGARLVFASDHSISTNTDYEDYRCMVEVYREHMMY